MKNAFYHKNRYNVVDMFRPPPGYRLESAIGTSYSVDFIALTSVMLAFADAEIDDDQKASVPQQLFAFTRLTERMKLFVNRGNILLSGVRESSRICSIYDSLVDEVSIPNGSFHPKLWLLSYAPKITADNVGAEPLFRVVVGSRNLTTSNCWELGAQLDGQLSNRKIANSIGTNISEYFSKIRKSMGTQSKVLDAVIEQLPFIQFSAPEGFTSCELAFQWPGSKELNAHLPISGKRAVIVSPFLGKTFIEQICKSFDATTLISSRREIETKLDEAIVKRLQPNLFYVNDDPSAEVATRLSLHAKLYFFELPNEQRMMLGSANASRNAWHGINSEAMISIPLGIDQSNFLKDFVFDPKRGNGLRPWIERYETVDWENREEETEEEKVENLISAAQLTLAQFRFELCYDRDAASICLKPIRVDFVSEIQTHLDNGLEIAAMPISMLEMDNEHQWNSHPLIAAFPDGISYDATIARLTQFICFRIIHRESKATRTIVLKSTRDNFGDFITDRNKELLRLELSAKQFAQFLAALLFERIHPARQHVEEILSGKKSSNHRHGHSYFDVLIEDVMMACTQDESKIADVNRILETFDGTDVEGNEFVDQGFREFWSDFRRAFDDGAVGS